MPVQLNIESVFQCTLFALTRAMLVLIFWLVSSTAQAFETSFKTSEAMLQGLGASANVTLTNSGQRINPYYNLYYFLDDTNQLSLKEVINKPFLRAEKGKDTNLAFGYTTDTIWIRIELYNRSEVEDWLFEVGYPVLDLVEFNLIQNGVLVEKHNVGDLIPYSHRPIEHRNFVFPLVLSRDQSVTVYLKVQSSSSVRIPINLWQLKHFMESDQQRILSQGIYFGILLIMMLYNLFIYFSIKEKAYLHYVFYVASYIVVQASVNGFIGQVLGEEPSSLLNKSTTMALSLVVLFGCSFSLSFLNLKHNHFWGYRIITSIALLGGLNFVASFFVIYSVSIKFSLLFAIIGTICITAFGLLLWIKYRLREARFFTIAWIGFLVGSLIMMLARLHLIPDNVLTENAAQMGSVFEVTLLSFALADKFSQIKGEKIKVESQAKQSLSQVNALLTETLERLQKSNQIKNDFLATVSHELRTPMNGIVASNQLLRELNLKGEAEEYLEIAYSSSDKMLALIDSMLQFVELQANQSKVRKRDIDINVLFKSLEQKAQSKITDSALLFHSHIPQDLNVEFYSDFDKVHTILLEFIDNAIKFSFSGEIHLGARISDDGRKILFFVSDNGIGIERKNQQKIFDAFYIVDSSSRRRTGGIGMGLTNAKLLSEILGGEIRVSSIFGEGSEFVFEVPLFDRAI
ncbi:hybrid sensor histidine kinase/response regulator [Aliikangiella sp. G2MR2-5]|uniref:sensor histidine kinase n=1 Tax=Aliikangiella sp. G2MR2-5 TaxID=2788943 RepID=UPI0018AB00E5|nr:hybrid sensor histidine kinase/response regulator [Aliikangiella sp. G2MR2-5]